MSFKKNFKMANNFFSQCGSIKKSSTSASNFHCSEEGLYLPDIIINENHKIPHSLKNVPYM